MTTSWRAFLGLCIVALGASVLKSQVHAVPVPVDEPGQSGSSSNTASEPGRCTIPLQNDCAEQGGIFEEGPQACWCNIYEWVPRRVVNASDGDVGLVPIDGRGSEIVTALTRAIGQFHRHAVMFYGDGSFVRHDTMYVADAEDGSSSDAAGDYVPVLTPLVGNVRFDGDALANGLPGAISQTIDDAYDRGRLASTGLILKPALTSSLNGGFSEPDRGLFAAAVAEARNTRGYYKLSDYTHQNSMSRPFRENRQGDLRGSHCSGYVTHFYRAQGLAIADVTYPAALRASVGQILFDDIRDQCRDETGFWDDLLLGVSGHWNACSNVANQVVNCFADRGCENLDDDWRTHMGSGAAVSPDNLLPDSFRYYGTTHDYHWGDTTLHTNTVNGRVLSHPGLAGESPTTSATSASPFKRVEALVYAGGYVELTERFRL